MDDEDVGVSTMLTHTSMMSAQVAIAYESETMRGREEMVMGVDRSEEMAPREEHGGASVRDRTRALVGLVAKSG